MWHSISVLKSPIRVVLVDAYGDGTIWFSFEDVQHRPATLCIDGRARESAPVAKDVVNYMGENTQPGVKAVAKAVTVGIIEGQKVLK